MKNNKTKKEIKELNITKLIEAPRDEVFKAWITPELMMQWFGPKNFSTPICRLDAQPDGEIYLEMEDLDGKRYPIKGVFEEIETPEQIVFTSSTVEDINGDPNLINRETISFREQDGGTKMTLHIEVLKATPKVAQELLSMELGWSQSFDKLGELMSENYL